MIHWMRPTITNHSGSWRPRRFMRISDDVIDMDGGASGPLRIAYVTVQPEALIRFV